MALTSHEPKINIVKSLRVAYFDCYSGISGDMILGALFDLGVDPGIIRKALKTLDLKGYKLKTSQVKRGLIAGTKVQVSLTKSRHSHHPARKYSDIKKLIADSDLSATAKKHLHHSNGHAPSSPFVEGLSYSLELMTSDKPQPWQKVIPTLIDLFVKGNSTK